MFSIVNKFIYYFKIRRFESVDHYIPKRQIGRPQKIPYNIFQTFKDKKKIPFRMKEAINSWILKNPEYNYYFFDDVDIDSYLKHFDCSDFSFSNEQLSHAYNKLFQGAGKADIFRLMIIYDLGGVYMDVDTTCINPLSTFVDPSDEVVSGLGYRGDFHQWGLIYTSKHPFIYQTLVNSVNNIMNQTFVKGFECLEGLAGPPCLDISIKQVLGKEENFKFKPGKFNESGICYTLLEGDYFNDNVLFKYPCYEQDLNFAGTSTWLSKKNKIFITD